MNYSIYINKKDEETLKEIPGDNVSQKIRRLIDKYVEARK